MRGPPLQLFEIPDADHPEEDAQGRNMSLREICELYAREQADRSAVIPSFWPFAFWKEDDVV